MSRFRPTWSPPEEPPFLRRFCRKSCLPFVLALIVTHFAVSIITRSFGLSWLLITGLVLVCGNYVLFVYVTWRRHRFLHRLDSSDCRLCMQCGYDLRGSGESGHCAECGTAFEAGKVQASWREYKWKLGSTSKHRSHSIKCWCRDAAKDIRRWRWSVRYWLTPPKVPEPPLVRHRRTWMWMGLMVIFAGQLAVAQWAQAQLWLVVLGMVLMILVLVVSTILGVCFRKRVSACNYMLCTECGYDLRGSPARGCCSECGCDYDIKQVQASWRAHTWRA